MSPRTPTLPPNDRAMWRRLVGRAHPDAGGENGLFVWAVATRDAICGGELDAEIPRRARDQHPERVPFDRYADFRVLTDRAVTMASAVAQPYGYLLRGLAGCYPARESDGSLYMQQRRGATYKQLAYIAHLAGMSTPERVQWYAIAESVPLSQRHAGHILSWLQKAAA
jgi:hypothetical protein